MYKAALKTIAGVAGVILLCAAILALFATVSNDEAAAHLGRISAHKMSGIAPGQVYEFVDGEPSGTPVCRLGDLSPVLLRNPMGDIEFRNDLGRLIPFVALLYDALVSEEDEELPPRLFAEEYYTIRWTQVVDLYIPAEDIAGNLVINRKCQSTIESLLTDGAVVCIIQRVMHHASSKNIVYAYDWRSRCIDYCPNGECPDADDDDSHLEAQISIWSEIKIALGLISSEVIVAEAEAEGAPATM